MADDVNIRIGGKESGAAMAATKVAAALLASAAAAGKMAQAVADLVNDINDMATRTGVAAETIKGLRLAYEGSGQSANKVEGAVRGLVMRMNEAAGGSRRAVEAFERLGVSMEDVRDRNVEAVLAQATEALQGIEDPGQRAALAMETMGRQAGSLMQALGTTELDAFIDRARIFGADVGPEASEAAATWQRSMADLKMVTEGTKTAFADLLTGPEGLTLIDQFLTGWIKAASFLGALFDEGLLPRLAIMAKRTHLLALQIADLSRPGGQFEKLQKLLQQELEVMTDQLEEDVLGYADQLSAAVTRAFIEGRGDTRGGTGAALAGVTQLQDDLVAGVKAVADETQDAADLTADVWIGAFNRMASSAQSFAGRTTKVAKGIASIQVIVSTAAAIMKTLAEPLLVYPSNVVMAGIVAAEGVLQLLNIHAARIGMGMGGQMASPDALAGMPAGGRPVMAEPSYMRPRTSLVDGHRVYDTMEDIGNDRGGGGGRNQSMQHAETGNF